MKVSREQVIENRRRILDAAARLFRERGFENVTVAEIMNAAGLTHGGVYGHFDSKEALINAAMGHEQTDRRTRLAPDNVAHYADGYLSSQHRDNISVSCQFSSLGTEAARVSPEVRHTLTECLRKQIETLSGATEGATPQERRRNAIAALSTMVGGMVLARIASDDPLSDEILSAARDSLPLE
jgi:TetR/AcrR family transcriptional repressor of nem operon